MEKAEWPSPILFLIINLIPIERQLIMAENIKEVMAKVDQEKVKTDSDQISDIIGIKQNGQKIFASTSGKEYTFVPVPLKKIPKLSKLISEIGAILEQSDEQMLLQDEVALTKMAEVINMGIRENIGIDQIMEEFSIGDFPKCFAITLDLNDFLSGMRNISEMKMKTLKR